MQAETRDFTDTVQTEFHTLMSVKRSFTVNMLRASTQSGRTIDRPDEVYTILSGVWLTFSRVVWAVLVALVLVIFFADVPLFYVQFQTVCASPVCNMSPKDAQTLGQLGISIKGFALANLTFALLLACVWFVVGGIIAWHKSNDWLGLLVSGMLILQGTGGVMVDVRASSSAWQLPSSLLNDLSFVLLSLVFFLFPDGRFVPRWSRWIVALFVVVGGLDILFPNAGVFYVLLTTGGLSVLLLLSSIATGEYPLRRSATRPSGSSTASLL